MNAATATAEPAPILAPVSIRQVMSDPHLFGKQFAGESWAGWRALLSGFYGLPLADDEHAPWQRLTRRTAPAGPFHELWLAIGRRGGKSHAAALLAVYSAAFFDYRRRLSPGEQATTLILAADKRQARTVMGYVSGLMHNNPMLEAMIVRESAESIELNNGSAIEVHTASFRTVRGFTVACCIADEIAFWRSENTANPDREIIDAIRPALATLDGKLIALSSPYSKRGELWRNYRESFGKSDDTDVLVAQAASRYMNPTLPQRIVDRAMKRDPEAARAEFMGQFRNDLAAFVPLEVVDSCTVPGRFELPPCSGFRYQAFTDPSGGSADAMTLAIAHLEDRTVVVDATREVHPPFSPDAVVKDFAELLKSYRIRTVTGDRYGGEWPRERFAVHGIEYQASELVRTELYRNTLPLLNAGIIELPDSKRLVAQFSNLERRSNRGGRETIDHPPGQHDDLCNAVAGVAAILSVRRKPVYNLDNL